MLSILQSRAPSQGSCQRQLSRSDACLLTFANMVLEVVREDTKAEYHDEVELFCLTPGEAWRQGRETDEQSIEVTTERPSEAGFYIVHVFDEAYYVHHNWTMPRVLCRLPNKFGKRMQMTPMTLIQTTRMES